MAAPAEKYYVFAYSFGKFVIMYRAGGHWPPLRPQSQQRDKQQFENSAISAVVVELNVVKL